MCNEAGGGVGPIPTVSGSGDRVGDAGFRSQMGARDNTTAVMNMASMGANEREGALNHMSDRALEAAGSQLASAMGQASARGDTSGMKMIGEALRAVNDQKDARKGPL